jgi:hypothetical protein
MVDILSAVSLALTSVKSASDIAKLIKEAGISLESAEVNLKMAEIIGALSDARVALADAHEAVHGKDKEIQKLKELLLFKERLVHDTDAYYEIDVNGKAFGDPYCQHCWEAKRLPVHLLLTFNRSAKCPSCKNEYRVDRVGTKG